MWKNNIELLAGKILCKIIQEGRGSTYKNLLIVKEKNPTFRKAIVLDVAQSFDDTIELQTPIQVGDIVYVRRQVGTIINIDNEDYLIIQQGYRNIMKKNKNKKGKKLLFSSSQDLILIPTSIPFDSLFKLYDAIKDILFYQNGKIMLKKKLYLLLNEIKDIPFFQRI